MGLGGLAFFSVGFRVTASKELRGRGVEGVAGGAGGFSGGSIAAPPRVGDREPLGMLVMVLGMTVLLLIMAQVTCMAPMRDARAASGPATVPATQSLPELSPGQMALLSSVPQMVAFGFMVLANRSIRPVGLGELGLTRGRIWAGVKSGLVGSVIVVPGVFLSAQLTEFLWRGGDYSHPAGAGFARGVSGGARPPVGAGVFASA